jgi:hypothetical protein
MHISCAICVQIVRESIKELKKLIVDVFFYGYLTYNALEQIVNAVPTSHNIIEILPPYKSVKGKHGKVIIHSFNDHIEIRDE